MFQTTASRSSALTSGSCGCGSSGSQKKTRKSISPSAISAPSCWSPPSGPLWSFWTPTPSSSSRSVPVVPVATSSWRSRMWRLYFAHSTGRASCCRGRRARSACAAPGSPASLLPIARNGDASAVTARVASHRRHERDRRVQPRPRSRSAWYSRHLGIVEDRQPTFARLSVAPRRRRTPSLGHLPRPPTTPERRTGIVNTTSTTFSASWRQLAAEGITVEERPRPSIRPLRPHRSRATRSGWHQGWAQA